MSYYIPDTLGNKAMMAAKRGGKRIGYVRVSSVDQNEARQVEAMADLHIDKIFIDKARSSVMVKRVSQRPPR
jgi:hypothetical protein